MVSRTWSEKAGDLWPQVELELLEFGLDRHQIEALKKHRGKVTDLELTMMRDMPPNPRTGRRPTISVVRSALHDLRVLGLAEMVKRR